MDTKISKIVKSAAEEVQTEKTSSINIPESAERHLRKLRYLSQSWDFLEKQQNSDDRVTFSDELRQIVNSLQNELTAFKDALIEEENIIPESVHHAINQIRAILAEPYPLRVNFAKELKILSANYLAFDIQEMMELVDKTNQAARTIEDKDIVLFLGDTGAGKTTTILYLNGLKMQKIITPDGRDNHIAPDPETVPEHLKHFTTSNYHHSVTRYVSAAPIISSELGGLSDTPLYLCDTPGFGDTGGAELELANSIGVMRAVQMANSVRPIVLLSSKTEGNRFEGIGRIGRLLANMIDDLPRYTDSVTFFFTRYDQTEAANLLISAQNALKDPIDEFKDDPNYDALIKSLIKQSRKARAVSILDVLNEDRQSATDILDDLADKTPILEPDRVFRTFIPLEALTALQRQVNYCQRNLLSAMEKNNFKLVEYRLDELKYLVQYVNEPVSSHAYEELRKVFATRMNHRQAELTDRFNRAVSDGNTLEKEDLVNYAELFQYSDLMDRIIRNHYSDSQELLPVTALMLNLERQISVLVSKVAGGEIPLAQSMLASEPPRYEELELRPPERPFLILPRVNTGLSREENKQTSAPVIAGPADGGDNQARLILSYPEKVVRSTLRLTDNTALGQSVDDGGCFFDSVAQVINTSSDDQGSVKHTEKSIRALCYQYYLEHREEVDEWLSRENEASASVAYDDVRFTADDLSSNNRAPIWGRPAIEGRILCACNLISELEITELLADPGDQSKLIPATYMINAKGRVSAHGDALDSEVNEEVSQQPKVSLLVGQRALHFIPMLYPRTNKDARTSIVTRLRNDTATLAFRTINGILNKLFTICEYFDGQHTSRERYELACRYVSSRAQLLFENLSTMLSDRNLDGLAQGLVDVGFYDREIVMLHRAQSYKQEKKRISECKSAVHLLIRNALKEINLTLQNIRPKNRLKQVDLDTLTMQINLIDEVKNHYALRAYLETQDIDKIHAQMIDALMLFAHNLRDIVQKTLELEHSDIMATVQIVIENFCKFREIADLDQLTAEIFFDVIDDVCSFIRTIRLEAEKTLQGMLESNHSVMQTPTRSRLNYHALARSISVLEDIAWINEIRPGTSDQVYTNIRRDIQDHFILLKESFEGVVITMDEPDNVELVCKGLASIVEMHPFDSILPELEVERKRLLEQFQKSIYRELNRIKEEFSLEKTRKLLESLHLRLNKELMPLLEEYKSKYAAELYLHSLGYASEREFNDARMSNSNKLSSSSEIHKEKMNQAELELARLKRIILEHSDTKMSEVQSFLEREGYTSIEQVNAARIEKEDVINCVGSELALIDKYKRELDEQVNCYEEFKRTNPETEEARAVLKMNGYASLAELENDIKTTRSQIEQFVPQPAQGLGQATAFSKEYVLPIRFAKLALNFLSIVGSEARRWGLPTSLTWFIHESRSASEGVNDYLKEYVRFLGTQIDEVYSRIQTFPSEIDNNEIQMLRIHFKNLFDLKVIESIEPDMTPIYAHWDTTLQADAVNMATEVETIKATGNSQKLSELYTTARALSQTDGFFPGEKRFTSLSLEIRTLVNARITDNNTQLNEYIKSNDFRNIPTALAACVDVGEAKQLALSKLGNSINQLISTTQRMLALLDLNLETTAVTRILDQFDLLNEANEHGVIHLLRAEVQAKISEGQSRITADMTSHFVRYQASIEQLIVAGNFVDAAKKIEHFRKLLSLLMASTARLEQNLNLQVEQLEQNLRDRVQSKVEEYEHINFLELHRQPPKSLYKMITSLMENNAIYTESRARLLLIIDQKFAQIFQKIEVECRDELSLRSQLQRLENCLTHCPEEISGTLREIIASARENLERTIVDQEQSLKTTIDSQNIAEMLALYNKHLETSNTPNRRMRAEISKAITERLKTAMKQFKEAMRMIDIPEAFKLAKQLVQESSIVTNIYTDREIAEIPSYFTRLLDNEIVKPVSEVLNFRDVSKMSADTTTMIRTRLHYLYLLHLSRNEIAEDPQFVNLFSHEFDNQFEQFNLSLHVQLLKNREQYLAALGDSESIVTDINGLKESLDFLRYIDQLPGVIKEYVRRFSNMKNLPSSLIQLTQTALDLKTFADLSQMIIDRARYAQEFILAPLYNEKTRGLEKEQIQYYDQLAEQLAKLKCLKEFNRIGYVTKEMFDFDELYEACASSLIGNIKNIIGASIKILDTQKVYTDKDLLEIRLSYTNLDFFMKKIPMLSNPELSEASTTIKHLLFARISLACDAIKVATDIKVIVTHLVAIKVIAEVVYIFKDEINIIIDNVLSEFRKKSKGGNALQVLSSELQSSAIGQIILSEHTVFAMMKTQGFITKTKAYGLEYVKSRIEGSNIDIDRLLNRYQLFEDEYQTTVKIYLNTAKDKVIDTPRLVASILSTPGRELSDPSVLAWSHNHPRVMTILMAKIFALWTLLNAEHYFEISSEGDDGKNYLVCPHPAQVITIFRMLGIGDAHEDLVHSVVQMGTGEGKSVVLAVTAAVLALMGADVSCACYSEYLTRRDYNQFLPIFNALGVTDYIAYGTFSEMSERVINAGSPIRERILNLVLSGVISGTPTMSSTVPMSAQLPQNSSTTSASSASAQTPNGPKKVGRPKRVRAVAGSAAGDAAMADTGMSNSQSSNVSRPKILLVDELDVFFSKDFYGETYNPTVLFSPVHVPEIRTLVDAIWKGRKVINSMDKLSALPAYQACYRAFGSWGFLIEEAAKDMIRDANAATEPSHQYVVKDNKIGYIDQDGISFKISLGYKTMFAYYHEVEQQKITASEIDSKVGILLRCGNFSYAEMPKLFQKIIGATGTLKSLSAVEKRFIENDYGIRKQSFMPSVFGENRLVFAKVADLRISDDVDRNADLVREIESQIRNGGQVTRAVMVSFESREKLFEFASSVEFKSIALSYSVEIMTEDLNADEKEYRVKKATRAGQITLCTRSFGRGTDFICADPTVLSSRGPHEQLTFWPEQYSEEVQIRGRVARQGTPGSFSILLKASDLEKFGVTPAEAAAHAADHTLYEYLDEKRNQFFEKIHATTHENVDRARVEHLNSMKLLEDIQNNDIAAVEDFLRKRNKGANFAVATRTLVLMDATGSMAQLLAKSKSAVAEMFLRANQVLLNAAMPGNFEVQLAFFRNYNSKFEKILQISPWESKPDNLLKFMNTINVEGGWGEEAIEVGLAHAVKQATVGQITQVILIGDAPPNSPTDVVRKRADSSLMGEQYWQTHLGPATDAMKQAAQLKQRRVPVHAFFVSSYAQKSFAALATQTGGKCEPLQIDSPAGAERLTKLVTEEILNAAGGGGVRGEALVQAYRLSFG